MILIVKNVSEEGPGLLENVLKERSIFFEIVDLEKGEPFPNPKKYSAVIVLGGPDSANDTTPKIQSELARIKEIIQNNIPYLGICLGLQLLVKAAGGEVYKSKVKEVGWKDPQGDHFEVDLTLEGVKDPLFNGLQSPLKVFQLHGETVNLIPGMKLLATGKFCLNQVVKVAPKAYGIQSHFELSEELFHCWIKEDPDLKILDPSLLEKDYQKIKTDYEFIGKKTPRQFPQNCRIEKDRELALRLHSKLIC